MAARDHEVVDDVTRL